MKVGEGTCLDRTKGDGMKSLGCCRVSVVLSSNRGFFRLFCPPRVVHVMSCGFAGFWFDDAFNES